MKPAFRLTPVIAALGVAAGLTFDQDRRADQSQYDPQGVDRRMVNGRPPARSPSTATWSAKALTRRSHQPPAASMARSWKPSSSTTAANPSRVRWPPTAWSTARSVSWSATSARRDHRRRRRHNNEGVVMVTPSATSPALTDGKNYEFIFRTIGRDDQQGPAAAKFVLEKLKPKKVAVLHDKQSYGQGIATAVRTTSERAASRSRSSKASTPATATTPPSSPSSRAAAWTSSTTAAHPKWACCCARRPNRA